jgi:hypothetical protein
MLFRMKVLEMRVFWTTVVVGYVVSEDLQNGVGTKEWGSRGATSFAGHAKIPEPHLCATVPRSATAALLHPGQ